MVKSKINIKKIIFILIDVVLINLAYILALEFRFNFKVSYGDLMIYENSVAIITLIYIVSFHIFKLYDNLWHYASIDEFMLVIGACIFGNLCSIGCTVLLGARLPYTVSVLAGMLLILFIIGFRMSFRISSRLALWVENKSQNSNKESVMVIGAGRAGSLLIKEMKLHPEMNYKPVAFIDDDKAKLGTKIGGVKVLGNRNDIVKIAKEKSINIILLAIPSMTRANKKELINICKSTNCKLKVIPGVYEIIEDRVSLSEIRDVDVEDLLGRGAVKLDMSGIEDYICNEIVLVTGGGGSIGSELCRQIAKFKPKQLIILDIYENNAYDLQNELKYKYPNLNLKVLIASVRDKQRLNNIFKTYNPDVVFHAAAHKHVPLMEDSPMEAIKNNVFGTYNVAECADKYKVKSFVLISTDKAVNPTNIMGASKRMCEMVIQAFDKISETQYAAVRFGNVLGSNGSVIPLFKKQIAQGGPVTVTNKYITRFFMTIPEAAQLVLQAGAFAKGGEIFVLDMGQPVKIYDLACDLIRLSGFEPNKDIKIEVTGLRPGEKLYEELLMSEEGLTKTGHEKIFIGNPMFNDIEEVRKNLKELNDVLGEEDEEKLIEKVKEIVPSYCRNGEEEVAASS